MKVLVNQAGWALLSEPEEQPSSDAGNAATKTGSGVFAKAERPADDASGAELAADRGDWSPESFSPTEPAPASDDPADGVEDVKLPPPPSLPRI